MLHGAWSNQKYSPLVPGGSLYYLVYLIYYLKLNFLGKESIIALMDAVDKTIPTPERPLDEPFFLPIEHVHSIVGRYRFWAIIFRLYSYRLYLLLRGTVITGRAERGKVKTGQELEIIGYGKTAKSKVTGIPNSFTLLLLEISHFDVYKENCNVGISQIAVEWGLASYGHILDKILFFKLLR